MCSLAVPYSHLHINILQALRHNRSQPGPFIADFDNLIRDTNERVLGKYGGGEQVFDREKSKYLVSCLIPAQEKKCGDGLPNMSNQKLRV